ncbi:MAG: 16S rRNA (guanine(966)-N(2))-methyltransferase RsmD [Bacteroidales bacterium]|jgi:16S rRNA (guanine(966)-N(2))-methyltransferase RsmD|nr:16S rRNA (guanine(966)-N(2))-methyltransferase RsmD [Bacteroidales bacterium]
MRIVSGILKGRQFEAPKNLPVRPTTDMAKESLFNILNHRVDLEELVVLDLFAGIGSIALEFLSRNVKSVTAVDKEASCTKFIREIAEKFDVSERLILVKDDVFRFVEKTMQNFDLIFADPPYSMPNFATVVEGVFENNLLKTNGIFILEHSGEHNFSQNKYFVEERKYGKVHFSFFSK